MARPLQVDACIVHAFRILVERHLADATAEKEIKAERNGDHHHSTLVGAPTASLRFQVVTKPLQRNHVEVQGLLNYLHKRLVAD